MLERELAQTALDNALRLITREDIQYADLHILDDKQNIIPFLPKRAQEHFLSRMTGRDLILKARQMGFSTAIEAWLFKEALNKTSRIGILAHDDETTQKMRDMHQLFYDQLPEHRRPERAINNATRTYYPRTKSMVYIGTAGNTNQGRGGTYSHVHGSEVAFWKDAGKTLSGLMQGVPKDGSIILESTPNGARGWFYQQCMDALDGKGIWTLHFYAWWWDDRYRLPLEPGEVLGYTPDEQALVDEHELSPEQIKWRRGKIDELHESFKQEYPEDPYSCFLASGNSYFGNIEQVYKAQILALPIPGRRYVAGLDFGQSTDYTVLAIFDAETFEMVAMLRINQQPWQEMRRQISLWANRFKAEVIGEANSMGKTNIELLQSGETLENGLKIEPINLTPFDTTPQSKPPLIQGLHHALHESGMTLLDDPVIKHEFRSFISRQSANGHWSYEAVGDEHDDIVIACALAWHGINLPPKKASVYRLDGGGLYSSRRG